MLIINAMIGQKLVNMFAVAAGLRADWLRLCLWHSVSAEEAANHTLRRTEEGDEMITCLYNTRT